MTRVVKFTGSRDILAMLAELPPMRRVEALNFCIAIVRHEHAAALAADSEPQSVDAFLEQLRTQKR